MRGRFTSVISGVLPGVLLLIGGTVSASKLDDAYRIEIEQLNAEKEALTEATTQSGSTTNAARVSLKADIERLTATLTRLRAKNTMDNQRMPELERLRSIEDQEREIAQLRDRMATWMKTRRIEGPSGDQSLHAMIESALEHVEHRGGLRKWPEQEFFGENGVARRATVLRIADVGAVIPDDSYRPLVLTSDGSLKVASEFQTTSAVYDGAREISAILFDPHKETASSHYRSESWQEWMSKGGTLMWAIALLAVISILLVLERSITLSVALFRVGRCRRSLNTSNARVPPNVRTYPNDPLFLPVRTILSASGPSSAEQESQAAEALLHVQPSLVRGVSFLGIVASVAPLLGLLGTVTGMISTFSVITEHGTGDPRLFSGGISEALLTTQFGLMVAIPALLFHTGLLRWAHVVLSSVERIAIDLVSRSNLAVITPPPVQSPITTTEPSLLGNRDA